MTELQDNSVAASHSRIRYISGKKVQINYEEILQPNGSVLTRYKTYVDHIPSPLEFVISKEVLQMIQKNHDQSIYRDIPDSIWEWFEETAPKTFLQPIIENGKPVSSLKNPEWV
jgi:hypothetical protein